MKLLRPFTGTGAVFFPVGSPPIGTCEFSTEKCREHCYVTNVDLYEHETDIPAEELTEIYNSFMTLPIDEIIKKLTEELDGLQTPILHWFGTGDCMTKDIQRVSDIIDKVPRHIVQMGFTRNEKLWEGYPEIFALTLESRDEVGDRKGMFSISDYDETRSIMYSPDYVVKGGYCGPIVCIDLLKTELAHFINCQVCRKIKGGCFDRRNNTALKQEGE